MAKWVMQEFSETEHGTEMLLVRPGESLPRKQALSAISGQGADFRTRPFTRLALGTCQSRVEPAEVPGQWQVERAPVQRDRWGFGAYTREKVSTVLLPWYALPGASVGSVSSR